jgi:hypothetical protein
MHFWPEETASAGSTAGGGWLNGRLTTPACQKGSQAVGTMDLIDLLHVIGTPKLRRDAQYLRHGESSARFMPAGPAEAGSIAVGMAATAGRPFRLALADLAGHGLVLGSTGGGKTWAVASVLQQLEKGARPLGWAVVDPKGDLFKRAIHLIEPEQGVAPLIVDFTGLKPVPYGLLLPQNGETPERLVDRRMAIFDDVLGHDGSLSLRMSRALRNVLLLAVHNQLAFPMVEYLLSNGDICRTLGRRSSDERVSAYFKTDFDRERNTTVPALLARLDFLLRTAVLRLSFGADRCVDYRTAMDTSAQVLVNTGGPALPRSVSQVIQSLVVSDLRQAVFARQERSRGYLWFIDEAQTVMSNQADTDNLTDLLTMARSFGVGLALMTQSVTAASPSRSFVNQLETNTSWMAVFRCGLDDARLIEPGLAIDKRSMRERHLSGRSQYLTVEQERRLQLEGITRLPSGEAYVWPRADGRPATKVRFPRVCLPKQAPWPRAELDAVEVGHRLAEQQERLRSLGDGLPSGRKNSAKMDLGKVLARLDQAMTGEHRK